MMQMLGQMMMMPFSMLTGWMGLFASGLRGMQPQGWEGRETSVRFGNAPGTGFPEIGSHRDNQQRAQGVGANEAKEERKMSDCCCDNNNNREVKLVEYTIVSIKRCDERIIAKGEVIYSDDMSDEAFATWVIARYFQGEDLARAAARRDYREESREERENRERREREEEEERGRRLAERYIAPEEKKYLRVYHHVLESWPRPDKDCCDDRQVDVLRGIEQAIRDLTGSRALATT
jgi:hypothetical protein